MSGLAISQLPNSSPLVGSEFVPLVQSGEDVKATPLQLQTFVLHAPTINSTFNSLILGAGSAITSSGPGGALGTGAFATIANYAPLVSPTLTTPVLGVATGTSLALGGATIGANAIAWTGTAAGSGAFVLGGALTYGGVALSNAVTGTGNMVLSGSPTLVTPALGVFTATSGAFGGALIGSNALAVTGTAAISGNIVGNANVSAGAAAFIYWASGSALQSVGDGVIQLYNSAQTNSVILTAPTANATPTLQLGNKDAAVAVAQTLRVQSVVAGTAAANGANWTLIGSLPTGTGTSGDIIFQTGVKTGSGTTQGTPTTALTIKGETQLVAAAAALQATGTVLSNAGVGLPAGGASTYGLLIGSAPMGVYAGSGAPTLSAAQGSLYLRSDGGVGTRAYINTNGTTGWTTLVSAS